jgi:ABC-type multidrug transport system fused ATPase/permease subunit
VFGKSFVSFVKGRYLKYLGEYCYKKIMLKDFLDFSKNTPAFYSEVTLRTTENMLNIIADYDNTGGLVFAFKILFYMITIYTLDKTSGILMVLFSILILISLGIANKFYYKRSKIVQDEFLDIKAYVSDMFKGMEEIKLFEAQNFEMELFENKVTPTWKKKNYLYSIDYILSFLTRDLISMIFYLLIIYRGIKSANAGTFFALINLFTLIRYQLFTSIGLWDNIRVGIISARQLEEFVG